MTFLKTGEELLSEWMAENAFVTWVVHRKRWELETEVIGCLSLPLNLDRNQSHPFHSVLTDIRRQAKLMAKNKPVADESSA